MKVLKLKKIKYLAILLVVLYSCEVNNENINIVENLLSGTWISHSIFDKYENNEFTILADNDEFTFYDNGTYIVREKRRLYPFVFSKIVTIELSGNWILDEKESTVYFIPIDTQNQIIDTTGFFRGDTISIAGLDTTSFEGDTIIYGGDTIISSFIDLEQISLYNDWKILQMNKNEFDVKYIPKEELYHEHPIETIIKFIKKN